MAIPACYALLFNIVFNITDVFFAGMISVNAQAAMSYAFPIYFIQISLCIGMSQSISVLVAQSLGRKKFKQASKVISHGMYLSILLSIFILCILLPTSNYLLKFLGADGVILDLSIDYLYPLFYGSPIWIFVFLLYGSMSGMGNTVTFRNATLIACIINIALDPIFIFGWGFIPAFGISGVGWATIACQFIIFIYMSIVIYRKKMFHKVVFNIRSFDYLFLYKIIKTAAAPSIRILLINVGYSIIIFFLSFYSAAAVAGYIIALRLERFFLVPIVALENAVIAYSGQNLGANNYKRVISVFRKSCIRGIWFTCLISFFIVMFGETIIGFFTDDDDVIRHGLYYLWMAAATAPLYAIIEISSGIFLSTGNHKILLGINIGRFVMPIFFVFCSSVFFDLGVFGLWFSLFLSNFLTTIYVFCQIKRIIKNLPNLKYTDKLPRELDEEFV